MSMIILWNDFNSLLKVATDKTKKLCSAGFNGVVDGEKSFPNLFISFTWFGTRDYNMAVIIIALYVYCSKSDDVTLRNFALSARRDGSTANNILNALANGDGKKIKSYMSGMNFTNLLDTVLKGVLPDDSKRAKVIKSFINQAGKITPWIINEKNVKNMISVVNILLGGELENRDDEIRKESLDIVKGNLNIITKDIESFAKDFMKTNWEETGWWPNTPYVHKDKEVLDTIMKFYKCCLDYIRCDPFKSDERSKDIDQFVKDNTLFGKIETILKSTETDGDGNNKKLVSYMDNEKFKNALDAILSYAESNGEKRKEAIKNFKTRVLYVGKSWVDRSFDEKDVKTKTEAIYKYTGNFAKDFMETLWEKTGWVSNAEVLDTIIKFYKCCLDYSSYVTSESDEKFKDIYRFVKDKTLFNKILTVLESNGTDDEGNNKELVSYMNNEKFKNALDAVLSYVEEDKGKREKAIKNFKTRVLYVGKSWIDGSFDKKDVKTKSDAINKYMANPIHNMREDLKGNVIGLSQEAQVLLEGSLDYFFYKQSSYEPFSDIAEMFLMVKNSYGESPKDIADFYIESLKRRTNQAFSEENADAIFKNIIEPTAEKCDGKPYFAYLLNGSKKYVEMERDKSIKFGDLCDKCPSTFAFRSYMSKKNVDELINHYGISNNYKGIIGSYFKKGKQEINFHSPMFFNKGEALWNNMFAAEDIYARLMYTITDIKITKK